MYERYCKLRDYKGYKDADVAKITDITKSTFTDWKSGKSKPNAEKLLAIAKCLDTTVEFLMTGEEPKLNAYSEEQAHLVAQIRKDTELSKALLKYFELSDVKKKHVVELINLLSEV